MLRMQNIDRWTNENKDAVSSVNVHQVRDFEIIVAQGHCLSKVER